jgi:hypothetical protein
VLQASYLKINYQSFDIIHLEAEAYQRGKSFTCDNNVNKSNESHVFDAVLDVVLKGFH